MKNNILILVLINLFTMANAQQSPNITGLYNLGSSSPAGGSHLFILDHGKYAITYFGGIQVGTWEKFEDNLIEFKPNNSESKFELYGRQNKSLNNTTKISFSGFERKNTYIQLKNKTEEEATMQRVFNKGANCFSYPYVHHFNTIAKSISFMYIPYGESNSSVSSFNNPEAYNDFVAHFIAVDKFEGQPFYATFKADKLQLEDEDKFCIRRPLETVGEDLEFIKNFIDKEATNNTLYLNPSYNIFGNDETTLGEQDVKKQYVFNEEKNAFIDTKHYIEGQENSKNDSDFANMAILYAYKPLKISIKKPINLPLNKTPLFQVNCN